MTILYNSPSYNTTIIWSAWYEKAGLRDGIALGIAAEVGLTTDEMLERFALKRGTK